VKLCNSYILDNLPSFCQKLSDLVEVWRSYNGNNFASFFPDTVYILRQNWACQNLSALQTELRYCLSTVQCWQPSGQRYPYISAALLLVAQRDRPIVHICQSRETIAYGHLVSMHPVFMLSVFYRVMCSSLTTCLSLCLPASLSLSLSLSLLPLAESLGTFVAEKRLVSTVNKNK